MNYSNTQDGYDRPRKPNFFLLFVLGAMALFLYTQYQKSQQQTVIPDLTIPDISNDRPTSKSWRNPVGKTAETPRPNSQNNDWSIDTDVATTPSASGTAASDSRVSSGVVERGDWSLEEGESTPSDTGEFGQKFGSGETKTTREGDWSLGEVDTKK